MEIQLYDYQEEMRQRIEAEFKKHRSLMVQMPTGTGKTNLLAAIVMDFIRKTKGHVWIVTHRRELVQQVKNTLKKFRGSSLDSELIKENASVYSIQWLTRHYQELQEKPVLIVIDEAHHAVAKTYSTVINAFPKAKILGLTATPCRLNGAPFTDLFEKLLQSWSINKFIAEGRLSLYDYMSIRPDSADINIITGMRKRGADGDYSIKEMSEKLDIRPTIERLCNTVLRYANGKKGIVYAINIQHAEHIAEFYRENGIKAVAISNKTPVKVREDVVRRFKETPTDGTAQDNEDAIQVVVNCELWGEGFDVPDAEFIQLARPTLSLSKYLQMVGRGLRVYDGKKFCLILDNVGSYRLLGLPSDDRDWEKMFEGKIAGKGEIVEDRRRATINQYSSRTAKQEVTDDEKTEMVTLLTHAGQRHKLKDNYGYEVIKDEDGNCGVTDKDENILIPCKYAKIDLKDNGIAYIHSRGGRPLKYSWVDLINRIWFTKQPQIIREKWLEFSATDNKTYYPRVKSEWMNAGVCIKPEEQKIDVDDGLYLGQYYIQPSEPRKLYRYIDYVNNKILYRDETGEYYVKTDYVLPMEHSSLEEWNKNKAAYNEEIEKVNRVINTTPKSTYIKERKEVEIGFLKFYEFHGAYRIIEDYPKLFNTFREFFVPTLTRSQIRMRGNICFLGNEHFKLPERPHVIYHICNKYAGGRWFKVEYEAYPSGRMYICTVFYDGIHKPQLINPVKIPQ